MNELIEAASEISSFMSSRGWEFCLIGGLAVQRWGEPRTTLDVDITVLTGWGGESPVIDALLSSFEPRMADAGAFALTHRILLLRATNGKDLDIALGALPFEENMIARAETIEFGSGASIPCCSAEDLVVMKAFAGRPRDWADVEGIARRQTALDSEYIFEQLRMLLPPHDHEVTAARLLSLLENPPGGQD